MSILTSRSGMGHLTEAVIHFNRAADELAAGKPNVGIARTVFDGLNKVQHEWHLDQPPGDRRREVERFTAMILGELRPEARDVFVCSRELRSLTDFQPQIRDHSTLNRYGYRPDTTIDSGLLSKATAEHRSLRDSFAELQASNTLEAKERVIKQCGALLYVVRSNIAHGEKTPYGPDLLKAERDEAVSAVVVPLLQLLVDLLLDRPSNKLAAYGTLAPSEVNHRVIKNIPGRWQECKLRGSLGYSGGIPTLLWNPSGDEIRANLFESTELAGNWDRLDNFEGLAYKRRLVTVETESGIVLANAYVRA